jgi:hypothetical protein
MYDNDSFGKSISEAQAEFEDRDIWTDHLEGLPVGQQIENAEQLLSEASLDEEGVEVLRPTREQEKQGRRDYDWQRGADLDHPYGMTLAAEERMLGQEQEMERHREQAVAAHEAGIDRERSARMQSVTQARDAYEDWSARADVAGDRDPEVDPREAMDSETLGQVNQNARRVAAAFEDAPSYAALSKEIAERVDSGESPGEAMMAVKERLVESEHAIVPIKELEASMAERWSSLLGEGRGDFEVSIQGTVETLYQPNSTSQQQVGWIADETGRAKVTIWRRSNCGTVLREGDTVRLRGLKVDWYNGLPSLAVTSTSEVQVLERGSGEAPIHGHLSEGMFDVEGETASSIDEEGDVSVQAALEQSRYRRPSTLCETPGWALTRDVVPAGCAPAWWVAQERVKPVEETAFTVGSEE